MSKTRKVLAVTAGVVGMLGIRAVAAPKMDPAVAGLQKTIQLLVLMETDGSGKVSKTEFLKFMESEFDRLDTNRNGVLDVNELTQPQVHVHAGGARR